MCGEAEEIQALCQNNTGDFILEDGWIGILIRDESYVYTLDSQDWKPDNKIRRSVWLPRQDQLQEMIGAQTPEKLLWELNCQIDDCKNDYTGELSNYYRQFTSMEQLWLAVVMKLKFNKTWTGEDWVNVA